MHIALTFKHIEPEIIEFTARESLHLTGLVRSLSLRRLLNKLKLSAPITLQNGHDLKLTTLSHVLYYWCNIRFLKCWRNLFLEIKYCYFKRLFIKYNIRSLCSISTRERNDFLRWPYRSRHALIVYAPYAMLHKWWDDPLSASILIILYKVTSNRGNIVASKGRRSHYLQHSCSHSYHNGSRVFIESLEQDYNDSNCSAH